MNNLHISLTDFRYESRILKQINSLRLVPAINDIYIAALQKENLVTEVVIEKNIFLKRFTLATRKFGSNPVIKILMYLEFILRVLFFYREKNIHVVNIHSAFMLPVGCLFKIIYGSKLVYDTHELETETDDLKGFKKLLIKLVEWSCIRKSDLVFVVSEGIADWYEKKYQIVRPTVLLNAPKVKKVRRTSFFREYFGLRGNQVIFLYQGVLSTGRGIEALIDVFSETKTDQNVLVIMGYGPLESYIRALAVNSQTVFFHDAVPPQSLLDYTSSADIGIALIENTCLSYYYCMPNKMFEYLAVGLPVLVSKLKDMSEFVKNKKVGWVVSDMTSKSLKKTISRISKSSTDAFKKNTLLTFEENSWEKQEILMVTAYKRLLNK